MKQGKKRTKSHRSFEQELRKQLKELEKIDPVDAYKMKKELGLSTKYYSRGDGFYR